MGSSAYVSANLDSGRAHAWQLAGELPHLLRLKGFILPGHWGEAAHTVETAIQRYLNSTRAVSKDLYKTIGSNDSRENIYSVCKVLAPSNTCALLNLHNSAIREVRVYLQFPVAGKEETKSLVPAATCNDYLKVKGWVTPRDEKSFYL